MWKAVYSEVGTEHPELEAITRECVTIYGSNWCFRRIRVSVMEQERESFVKHYAETRTIGEKRFD